MRQVTSKNDIVRHLEDRLKDISNSPLSYGADIYIAEGIFYTVFEIYLYALFKTTKEKVADYYQNFVCLRYGVSVHSLSEAIDQNNPDLKFESQRAKILARNLADFQNEVYRSELQKYSQRRIIKSTEALEPRPLGIKIKTR